MLQIIALNRANDDYGVYSTRSRGPYGTGLLFRGTFAECDGYRRQRSA